ncbi:MAG: LytTR family transcriptional regulator DNA-binding domain-containing protein [Chitinophagaceae bacterium]
MENPSLQLNTSTGNYLIDTHTIVRVEASSNYSKLYFSNGKVLVTAKLLKWFEERLPNKLFTRLHRSHLVNTLFLQPHQSNNASVRLEDGNFIQISKRRRKSVQAKFLSSFLLIFFLHSVIYSQSVGIGTTTPHASAQLDINSTTKGTLITTMTTTQRKAIENPATGLLVFDIDKKTIYMFDGTNWFPFLFSTTEKNPPTYFNGSGISADANFGYKVNIFGDYAVIGAHRASQAGVQSGTAYIYYRNNGVWQQQDVLVPADGADDDYFGASVSINSEFAAVGAWGDDNGANTNQGSVYIYSRIGTQWSQQTKILAGDGQANDYFGFSIDLGSGNDLVIGAHGDNIGPNIDQGSAYIYQGSAGFGGFLWALEAKLTANDGSLGDFFGASVGINSLNVVIGAYADDIGLNTDQGSVYSFFKFSNPGGWATGQNHFRKFIAPDGEAFDYYGVSVDVSSRNLVIGASGDDIGLNADQGSIYLYLNGNPASPNFNYSGSIKAPDGATSDNFGISVCIGYNSLAIGAYRADDELGIVNKGAVYIYKSLSPAALTLVSFKRKITDETGQANGYFGYSVSLSTYDLIIGAYGKNGTNGQIAFINIE